VLNKFLAAIAILGLIAWLVIRPQQERLQREYDRLSGKQPLVNLPSESEAWVRRLPIDDAMQFAWQVNVPKDGSYEFRSGTSPTRGRSVTGLFAGPVQARMSFRFTDDELREYLITGGMSVDSVFVDRALVEWLREHWSRFEIVQLPLNEAVEFDEDKVVTLLRIRLPRSAFDEEAIPASLNVGNDRSLFVLQLGTKNAFAAAQSAGGTK
jgi:hypothetical protein